MSTNFLSINSFGHTQSVLKPITENIGQTSYKDLTKYQIRKSGGLYSRLTKQRIEKKEKNFRLIV